MAAAASVRVPSDDLSVDLKRAIANVPPEALPSVFAILKTLLPYVKTPQKAAVSDCIESKEATDPDSAATGGAGCRSSTPVLNLSNKGIKVIILENPETYATFKENLESIMMIHLLRENNPPGCLYDLAFVDDELKITISDLPGVVPGAGINQCEEALKTNVTDAESVLGMNAR